MNTFKTSLGLTNKGGGYAFPISFSIEPFKGAVTPAKNSKLYAVNVYSIRLKTNSLERFRTAKEASQFIERTNKDGIFIANIIK